MKHKLGFQVLLREDLRITVATNLTKSVWFEVGGRVRDQANSLVFDVNIRPSINRNLYRRDLG
jgi:hypothetical protein